jgi:hypothetical protein
MRVSILDVAHAQPLPRPAGNAIIALAIALALVDRLARGA